MPDFSSQINEARQNGHSDDDIIGYLSARPDLAPKIKEAKSSGYGSSDILGYLGKQIQPANIPGIPRPPLPYGLRPEIPRWTGGSGNEPGVPPIVTQGVKQLAGAIPAFSNSLKRGASDLIEGTGKTLSPLLLPGIMLAPAATLGGIAGSMLGGATGSGISDLMGGDPETQRLAGDISSIPGGVIGGGVAESPSVRGFMKGAGKAAPTAIKDAIPAGAGAVLMHHYMPGPVSTVAEGLSALSAIPPIYKAGRSGAAGKPFLGPIANDLMSSSPARPLAARFEPSPTVLPDLTPIPSQGLPSGRKVGGIDNQTISTPKSSPTVSDTTGIEPMDLEAAASLMSNGKKSFAEMTGTARAEAIKRASAFSANRTPAPTVATPDTPVSTPAQSFVSPLEQQVTGGQPLTVPGAKLADLEGSLDTHLTARTAKIHNIHDYIATQTNLTPEAVEKLSPDEGLKLVKQASDWARGIGRTEGTLKNPKGKYASFNMQETNPDTGATTTGTKAEVLNLLRGNPPSVNHPRPPQYGPAPITPIK